MAPSGAVIDAIRTRNSLFLSPEDRIERLEERNDINELFLAAACHAISKADTPEGRDILDVRLRWAEDLLATGEERLDEKTLREHAREATRRCARELQRLRREREIEAENINVMIDWMAESSQEADLYEDENDLALRMRMNIAADVELIARAYRRNPDLLELQALLEKSGKIQEHCEKGGNREYDEYVYVVPKAYLASPLGVGAPAAVDPDRSMSQTFWRKPVSPGELKMRSSTEATHAANFVPIFYVSDEEAAEILEGKESKALIGAVRAVVDRRREVKEELEQRSKSGDPGSSTATQAAS